MSRTSAGLGLLGLLAGLACASVQGAGPTDPTSCDALAESYATALAEAQLCDPSASEPCAALRARRLDDPCHCLASVSPARVATLDGLAARWAEQPCRSQGFCNRACVAPSRTCAALPDGGSRCGGP